MEQQDVYESPVVTVIIHSGRPVQPPHKYKIREHEFAVEKRIKTSALAQHIISIEHNIRYPEN